MIPIREWLTQLVQKGVDLEGYLDTPQEYIDLFMDEEHKPHLIFDCDHADEIEASIAARRPRRWKSNNVKEPRWGLCETIKAAGPEAYAAQLLTAHREDIASNIATHKAAVYKNNKKRGYALSDEELKQIRGEELAHARATLGLHARTPDNTKSRRIPK